MGTTAFDLKDALYAELTTAAEFASLVEDEAIQYGALVGERPREVIWFGEIEWVGSKEQSAGLSPSFVREETYEMMLTIESHVPGDTQYEANQRVKGWMQLIEARLKDPRWAAQRGVSGIIECGIVPQMLAEGMDADMGRGAILVLALHVRARKS